MTTTQIPILGPERRFLTRREGLLLQGFPATHRLPESRQRTFAALGNAVHTDVAFAIAHRLLQRAPHESELIAALAPRDGEAEAKAASR
jgi:DNA (cytosine-5)-methyltransferase 1